MSKNVVITRPAQYQEETAEQIKNMGLNPIKAPLSEIIFYQPYSGGVEGYDYYIITSKNALRAITPLKQVKDKAIFIVGTANKNLAEKLGFNNITACFDTVKELKQYITSNSELRPYTAENRRDYLYISGEEVKEEIEFADNKIVYKNKFDNNLSLTELFNVVNYQIDNVLFYSLSAVYNFISKAEKEGLIELLQSCKFFAISKDVAIELNRYFNKIYYPNKPNSKELLRLLNDCGK